MLYKEWLNEWLAVCVKPTVKQRTYEKYERICRKHLLSLENYRLDELTAPVLQTFVAKKTSCLSPNTVNVITTRESLSS